MRDKHLKCLYPILLIVGLSFILFVYIRWNAKENFKYSAYYTYRVGFDGYIEKNGILQYQSVYIPAQGGTPVKSSCPLLIFWEQSIFKISEMKPETVRALGATRADSGKSKYTRWSLAPPGESSQPYGISWTFDGDSLVSFGFSSSGSNSVAYPFLIGIDEKMPVHLPLTQEKLIQYFGEPNSTSRSRLFP
jgi:hypothetical protein